MSALAGELGIEWRLLLTQGVNFFVLLAVLTVFAYRPLLKLLEERRKKIEFGLAGAEEARRRLAEIDAEKQKTLAAAEREAVGRIEEAEREAKVRAAQLTRQADEKAAAILEDAAKTAERQRRTALAELEREAAGLIKSALVSTVELAPDSVDEALIAKAAAALKS